MGNADGSAGPMGTRSRASVHGSFCSPAAVSRYPGAAVAGSAIIVVSLCVSMVSLAVVLVVAAVPDAGAQVARTHEQALVAPAWRAVEPLVHAPEAVQPARVRRVGVVDDAVLERKRAHAGRFPRVGRHVGAKTRRDL